MKVLETKQMSNEVYVPHILDVVYINSVHVQFLVLLLELIR